MSSIYYHKYFSTDPFEPCSIEFDVWSSTKIKKISVAKISYPISFDELQHPVVGGLLDPRLGPFKYGDLCVTCTNVMAKCDGHYGHIELPFPVFNPLFVAIVVNVLRTSCLSCYRIILSENEKYVLMAQLKLVYLGKLIEARELDSYLKHYNFKEPQEIRKDIDAVLEKVACTPKDVNNQCKNAEQLWKYYLALVFGRKRVRSCPHCLRHLTKVYYSQNRLYTSERMSAKRITKKVYMSAMDAMKHMRMLWKNEKDLLSTVIGALSSCDEEYPTDICFTSVVPVTPSNMRPPKYVNQKLVEHPKNTMYQQILEDCRQLQLVIQAMDGNETKTVSLALNNCTGDTYNDKLHHCTHALQISVSALLDANAMKSLMNMSVGIPRIGLKQLIEKKNGILRKNMMGKRVDFFARSVITPDPLLNIYEIGIPDAFAKILTFPVPVTPWNVTELRALVVNGPSSYPGANMIEASDGTIMRIPADNKRDRKAIAKELLIPKLDTSGPKVVHRHLVDGDMLLINRQPSLHKPSIMAHRACILKGEKTFRLHYANCKAYNADFDGDEMNAHLPQNEMARAEAVEIVNAAQQYLVPRDGTPLGGLIQDHVVAGFRLSARDAFFDRRQYQQLVFQALCFFVDDIELLPPAIMKPRRLWTGKQIISTIVINLTPAGNVRLTLNSNTKLRFEAWPAEKAGLAAYRSEEERRFMSDTNVIIRKGELLSGLLDKNHVGATHYGLVHCFYELYGGQHSANLLSAFSKVFTFYQQKYGFTLGVLDILVRARADRKRAKIAQATRQVGVEAAKKALDVNEEDIKERSLRERLEIAYKKNVDFRTMLDQQYKNVLDSKTNEINKICLTEGLLQPFPENNLQLMVQSGAKGSTVNTMQISCLLGQIELEGKRPPLMLSGKSLPSFQPYDLSPMAGGFIASRFMTGIQPQEFFFHCMAGREGLIDTAVKTSRSGYLQRCLVKHLEGLVVNYDRTVRDSDQSVIQFMYGEDGLDVSKSQLLNYDRLKFFGENMSSLYDASQEQALDDVTIAKLVKNRKNEISAWRREFGSERVTRNSAFLRFCREMEGEEPVPVGHVDDPRPGRSIRSTRLCSMWQNVVHDETKQKYATVEKRRCPDPVIADFSPDAHYSSVCENIENVLRSYVKNNKRNLPSKKKEFEKAVYLKSFAAQCQPGEPVGVLAAQSVGEPSTQMTLNTFHFAGRGEMNVTLGIPRLREILVVASKRIQTPITEIPFKTDVKKLEKKAEKLRKSLTRLALKDVLEKIVVKESIRVKKELVRLYELVLHYLPRTAYSNVTLVKPVNIQAYVTNKFSNRLEAMLKKHFKATYDGGMKVSNTKQESGTGKSSENKNEDDEKEEDAFDEYLGRNTISQENKIGSDDESDDNSEVEGDGDATEAKLRNRRIDGQEYEEEDDGDAETSKNIGTKRISNPSDESDLSDEESGEIDEDYVGFNTSISQPNEDPDNDDKTKKLFGVRNIEHDVDGMSWSRIMLWTKLSYKRLDLSSLLPREVESAVIHQVPGIKRAITYVNKEGLLTLKTEGSYGIAELFKHARLLNLNKLYSNDVHAMAETYGIEAANRVIIREVQEVFKVYGITVDSRHLSLIADYMTFAGTYQALNRSGMDNCPSPLQQMTFESTLKYLQSATVRRLKDNLSSPSGSLMIGRELKIGGGLIRLLCKPVSS